MNDLVLQRVTFSPDAPTLGVLLKGNVPLGVTFEPPWKDNQHDISCILPGTYTLVDNPNPKKPFRLLDVPGRTEVDLHAGNDIHDTLGCILVGTSFYPGGIAESAIAIENLKKVLQLPCKLTILNPP